MVPMAATWSQRRFVLFRQVCLNANQTTHVVSSLQEVEKGGIKIKTAQKYHIPGVSLFPAPLPLLCVFVCVFNHFL